MQTMTRTTVTLELRSSKDARAARRWLQDHLEDEHAHAMMRWWSTRQGARLRFDLECDEHEAAEAVRRALADSPVRVQNLTTTSPAA